MLTQIGEYRVVRLLGEGGMGAVYLGQERLSGRSVALKLLHEHVAASPKARELFLREMAIVARLDHPNVVRSLASLEHEGRLVLVLEYLEGTTLRSELSEKGAVPWQRVIGWTQQLCAALGAAHRLVPPVVHRDLKPENVMLLADGQLKVMDFGIARAASDARTGTTRAVGTLTYMSPEQIDAQGIDTRSDLYSLGVLLYELLTGHSPYRQQSPRQLLNAICTEPPLALPQALRAELPPAFETMLLSLLQKQPEQRPADVEAVVAQLEAIRTGSQAPALVPSGRPAPPPEPPLDEPQAPSAPQAQPPVGAVARPPVTGEPGLSRTRALAVMASVAAAVAASAVAVGSQLVEDSTATPVVDAAARSLTEQGSAKAAAVQPTGAAQPSPGSVRPAQPTERPPSGATAAERPLEAQEAATGQPKPAQESTPRGKQPGRREAEARQAKQTKQGAPSAGRSPAPDDTSKSAPESPHGQPSPPLPGFPSGPLLSQREAEDRLVPLVRKCLEKHKIYMVETRIGQGDAKDTGPIPRISIVDKYSSVVDWRRVQKLGSTPVGRCIDQAAAPIKVRAYNVHYLYVEVFNDLELDPLAGAPPRFDQKAGAQKASTRDERARACNQRFVDSSKPGTQFGVLFTVRGIDGQVTKLRATPTQAGQTPWGKCIVDAYKGLTFERFRRVEEEMGYYLKM